MADTTTAVIPYESLDPLTIGASGATPNTQNWK